ASPPPSPLAPPRGRRAQGRTRGSGGARLQLPLDQPPRRPPPRRKEPPTQRRGRHLLLQVDHLHHAPLPQLQEILATPGPQLQGRDYRQRRKPVQQRGELHRKPILTTVEIRVEYDQRRGRRSSHPLEQVVPPFQNLKS